MRYIRDSDSKSHNVLGSAPVAIIDLQLPFEYTIASRSTDVMVLVLRVEKKLYVIEQPIPPAPAAGSTDQSFAEWNAVYDAHNEELKSMFEKQAGVESVGLILNGLTSDFAGFVRNYNMHNMGKTIGELHALLIEYEKCLPKKAATPQVLAIQGGIIQKSNKKSQNAKGKGKGKGKGKYMLVYVPKPKNPKPSVKEHLTKDDACHHYKEGLRGERKLKQGVIYLYVGNGVRAQVEAIGISKSDVLYFNAMPRDGIYEIDMLNLVQNVNSIYNVSNKRAKHNLNSTYLWHYHLAHISKKRIEQLQHDELLKSTDDESFDQCVSCLSGKMTRKPFLHRTKRVTDLLGLTHNDVYGPLRHALRQGASYFITFTDDFSHYGYVYLLEHKHEDYALESDTRILNMVPTKKVDKRPYELWYGKVPNLSYLRVWGCETLMKRDTPDKLQQRSIKCIFIGYPKETMGYYLYFPPENKIVVARYAEFLEKNLISQEANRRAVELEEIQDEDKSPSKNTSEIPAEVEGFEPPQEEVAPFRRSVRTHRAPERLCLNVEVEEDSLRDLNEPANYKAALLDLEYNKWLDSMNAEMQSMKDNQVWCLVDLPPNVRLVANGYTQIYRVDYEETFSPVVDIRAISIFIATSAFYHYEIWQMDVKTAFLNGYLDEDIYMVQPEGFIDPKHPRKASGSNVAFLILYVDDIIIMGNHIPMLQSVKTYFGKCFAMKDLEEAAFILGIKIYRDRTKRLIGLSQSAYMDKILKRFRMDNSKRGNIPMQERLDLNKTQGASTPEEVKRMQTVPYASAVRSIMYAVRCTRPDVAFAQNITSRFQQNLGEPHWTAVKTILKNPEAELRVTCYCDAGFETDRDDIKSLMGYVFILNGGAIDCKSFKKSTTAMSATEAKRKLFGLGRYFRA
ncbi:retrotransposon protein, putative, ty1-copia subclass, partial [Tanacetum coccineum]